MTGLWVFQFQNGAIIRVSLVQAHYLPSMFQFQNGAIISNRRFKSSWRRTFVSIPKWCDYKFGNTLYPKPTFLVSIPKWCDYKRSQNYNEYSVYLFQFQNGAIISNFRTLSSDHNLQVSIPKWCDYKGFWFVLHDLSHEFQFQNGAIIRYLKYIVL